MSTVCFFAQTFKNFSVVGSLFLDRLVHEEGGTHEDIDIVRHLGQGMIVIVDIHLDLLPEGLELIIELVALAVRNPQIRFANQKENGRVSDLVSMSNWGTLVHRF